MAQTTLIPCHENLPRWVAHKLAATRKPDLSSYGLIVPTQRLLHYIRFELAREMPACIPPRMYTLERFVAALPAQRERRIIDRTDQKLILNYLLGRSRYRYFQPGIEGDLARFFDELANENWREQIFPRWRELLQQDPFRSEKHLDRLLAQVDELEQLYNTYLRFLEIHDLSDSPHAFNEKVVDFSDGWGASQVEAFDALFVIGFADATASQNIFFRRLLQSEHVRFWFHGDRTALENAGSANGVHTPLQILSRFLQALGLSESLQIPEGVEAESGNTTLVQRLFALSSGSGPAAKARIFLHEAPTILAEVKGAAALVRELIHAGSCEPHELVVAVPQGNLYGRLVWSVFEEAGIPLNYSLGMPFTQTRCGQWIRLFIELVKQNWRLIDLLGLFANPNMVEWLQDHGFNDPPDSLRQRLHRFARKYDIPAEQEAWVHTAEKAGETELQKFFSLLQSSLGEMAAAEKLPLQAWAANLWHLGESLQLDRLVLREAGKFYNLEQQAIEVYYRFLQHLEKMGEALDQPLAFSEIYGLLSQNLFSAEIMPVGQPFVGVQVMNLLEARSIPAKALLVLGNMEGSFPAAIGRELFVPEPMRHSLNLTTAKKFEQLQDQLFYRLIAGVPEAHLFYCQKTEETPEVPSRYIQRLNMLRTLGETGIHCEHISGLLYFGDYLAALGETSPDPALRSATDALRRQIAGRTDTRGRFRGARVPLFTKMSATILEDLLYCPYRFLLLKLHMRGQELPEEEGDRQQVGIWAHKVCELFFRGLPAAMPVEEGWDDLYNAWPRAVNEADRERAVSRLQRLSRVLSRHFRVPLDELYHMLYSGWPLWVAAETARPNWHFAAEDFECELEGTGANILDMAGCEVTVSGRIDRILRHEDCAVVLDYKLRKPAITKKKVYDGLSPQIPLYIKVLMQSPGFAGLKRWAGEYYSLETGERLQLGSEEEDARMPQAWEALEALWEARMQNLLQQDEPFAPEETDEKCKYCEFTGICRKDEIPARSSDNG